MDQQTSDSYLKTNHPELYERVKSAAMESNTVTDILAAMSGIVISMSLALAKDGKQPSQEVADILLTTYWLWIESANQANIKVEGVPNA